jgi:PAS domain S-box-containing protein
MPQDTPVFLPSGRKMSDLIRSHDWSRTPLGPMDQWPQTLLTTLATVLESPFPQFICWGGELTIIYNDPYIDLLGKKHIALGKRLYDVWPEARETIEPLIEKAFAGESVLMENVPFTLQRHGYSEQTRFDFSFSPLRDGQGNVCGLLNNTFEMTNREKELQKAHGILKGITTGTEDLIAAQDQEFRYLFFNDAYRLEFKKLWGREIGIGTSMIEAMAPWPDEQKKARDLWQRALNGEAYNVTMEFGPPERVKQVYDLRFNPILDANGSRIGAAHILRNVTEQVRMQEELRESRARLEAALTSIPDAVFITNAEGQFIHTNEAFATYHRFRDMEECSRTIAECPDTLEAFFEDGTPAPPSMWAVPRALRGEVVTYTEYRLRRKDTGEEWVGSYSFAPIRNEDGEIIGSVVVARDVTDEKHSEEALRESEFNFRTLAENMSQFAWMTDEKGWIIWYNKRWYDYTGTTFEQMQGWGWREVHHPDHVERVVESFSRSLKTGEVWEDTFPLRRKDGEYRWFLSRAIPIWDEHGKILRWFGTNTDVTELREAKEEAEWQSARSKAIFDNMAIGVCVADSQGNFIDINPAGLAIHEYDSLEEIQRNLVEFPELVEGRTMDGRLVPVDEWPMARALRGETFIAHDLLVTKKDTGRTIATRYSGSSVRDSEGNIILAIITFTDITTQKRIEKELRTLTGDLEQRIEQRTKELKQANRAKDEFLANMSHEIRTPMAGILGLTEILLHQELHGKIHADLGMIRSSAESVMSLINDLFDLSRISQGKFEFHPSEFDLREMIQNVIGPFEFQARSEALDFVVTIDEGIPSQIQCDKDRLGQVIKNLVSNSIKFTEHGYIRVEVKAEEVDDSKLKLFASVSDSGIGIPKSKQKDIFSAFTQLDSTYSKKFAGMGLGLAISKSLVEGMGGEIKVDSVNGRGTTFSFYVTCGIVTGEQAQTAASITLSDLPPMTILLVEDNSVNRLFLRRALVTAGHKVGEAEDGKHALTKLGETHFDLVLMDIQMPEMDGVEATRRIRTGKHGQADIPIIALTAYAMKGDREKFLENGMDGYVTKPVDFGELARVIAEVCGVEGTERKLAK